MLPIAIVTATPPGINPGMLACEATLWAFVRRAGLADGCTFFRLHSLEERVAGSPPDVRDAVLAACDLGISWERLEDRRQLDGRVPLYWGDFLHMRRYHAALAGLYPDGIRAVQELLLLAASPDHLLRRTVSFGTSFLFNSTADFRDQEYSSAFTRFFSLAHHIQMRDAISAGIVTGLRSRTEGCFGVDPAQLLALPSFEDEVLGSAAGPGADGRMLVFVARACHDQAALVGFLEKLGQATGATPAWLPWGDRLSFPFLGEPTVAAATAVVDGPRGRFAPLAGAVRRAKVVVTDTYHLAVIAWALGVPAIVLAGEPHAGERSDKQLGVRVRHDKRKVLLAQDGLLDFYIEPALLTAPANRDAVVERLAAAVADPAYGSEARERLAVKAAASVEALQTALEIIRSGSLAS
jgi:hypothetical protein